MHGQPAKASPGSLSEPVLTQILNYAIVGLLLIWAWFPCFSGSTHHQGCSRARRQPRAVATYFAACVRLLVSRTPQRMPTPLAGFFHKPGCDWVMKMNGNTMVRFESARQAEH